MLTSELYLKRDSKKKRAFLEDLQTDGPKSLLNKAAGQKAVNSIRTGISTGISQEFCEIFTKTFCRTPPRNHFSHDGAFFPFYRLVRFAA